MHRISKKYRCIPCKNFIRDFRKNSVRMRPLWKSSENVYKWIKLGFQSVLVITNQFSVFGQ